MKIRVIIQVDDYPNVIADAWIQTANGVEPPHDLVTSLLRAAANNIEMGDILLEKGPLPK